MLSYASDRFPTPTVPPSATAGTAFPGPATAPAVPSPVPFPLRFPEGGAPPTAAPMSPLPQAPDLPTGASAVPGYGVPPPTRVVAFAPVRVRGGPRSGRVARWRGRALVAGLLAGAVWLAAPGLSAPHEAAGGAERAASPASARVAAPGGGVDGRFVTAPVRLADGGAATFLRAGDRVDVLAAEGPGAGSAGGFRGKARRIATCARVLRVPGAPASGETRGSGEAPWPELDEPAAGGGALILLRVRRATAEALAGAAPSSGSGAGARLVVAVC